MLKVLASPLRFPGRYPDLPLAPSPLLGADTEAVLRELCGIDAEDIARLIAAGVVACAPASKATTAGHAA